MKNTPGNFESFLVGLFSDMQRDGPDLQSNNERDFIKHVITILGTTTLLAARTK
jgi:hypothetical protein